MPHPIDYLGGQDDDQTRSIDLVHIEPSIREGLHLVSSIYGRDASAPIRRYAPFNKVQPYLTGDAVIPSVLTCQTGQWEASPYVQFAFQWMSNGVDIPGATEATWTSTEEYDSTSITCEVRAYNYLGESYEISSNSIYISLIEPIEIHDLDYHGITGLELSNSQINHTDRLMISSGNGAKNRLDTNRSIAYFLTGRSADLRHDVNTMHTSVISGIEHGNLLEMKNHDSISVINYDEGTDLVDGVPQSMPLKNPEAEMGTAGWNVFGAATYYSNSIYEDRAYTNTYSWWGGANVGSDDANIPYSYMWQDVPVFDVWQPEVDNGTTNAEVYWYQSSEDWKDQANIKLEFLDVNEDIIGTDFGPGLMSTRQNIWIRRSFEAAIPVGTRKVRIILEFNLQDDSNNEGMIDYVTLNIRKGDKITSRDFGPNFSMWRLLFTKSNTYSGVALSELEFRSTLGGTDLCSGGSVLIGSEGIGGLGSYAFDDLRNTGYWAGEENGVALGTSWLGYDMQTVVRPAEIDITARTGTNSLQVGKDFILQGSNDGINWIDVQEYTDVDSFSSGQQKQFEVKQGIFDWHLESAIEGVSYDPGYYYSDSIGNTKGNIWKAKTRLNISEVSAYVQSSNSGPVKFSVFKVSFEESNGLIVPNTMIQSEDVAIPSNDGWVYATLPEDLELEVGEFFAVVVSEFSDDQVDIRYYGNILGNDSTETLYNPYNEHVVERYGSWLSYEDSLYDSQLNEALNRSLYCVDFKGNVF